MADKKTSKKAKKDKKINRSYMVCNSLVSYYLVLMFSVFTLFLTHKYSSARHDKFYLFLGLSAVLAVSAVVSYLISRAEFKKSGAPLEPFFKPLSVVDVAFLSFLLCAVISAAFSGRFGDTIIAEVGRNNGLLLLFTYTAVFFIISWLYVYKDYVIAVYLVFSCIIALLTVINFFYIDPLGLSTGYSDSVVEDFGSTIGNKNLIASYMSLFLPVALMTFVINEKRWMRIIAGVAVAFGYMGTLSANSSSVILGLIIAVPVMAAIAAKKYIRLERYMLGLAILFASGKLLRLFSYTMNGHNKGFEFIQHFLIYDKLTYIPIAVFAVIYIAMRLLRTKTEPGYKGRPVSIAILALTCAGVIAVIAAMLHFTLSDTSAELGSFDKLLRFNDKWGTHRGYMWIRSMWEYGDFNFFKKLFGSGPDTAYYVLKPYFSELNSRFGDGSTDCAHNEYINYLITQGALGLISYLTVVIGVIVRAVKRADENPLALIFVSAIVCYAVQATVNLYQPITTPIFIIFIAIVESMNRRVKMKKQAKE